MAMEHDHNDNFMRHTAEDGHPTNDNEQQPNNLIDVVDLNTTALLDDENNTPPEQHQALTLIDEQRVDPQDDDTNDVPHLDDDVAVPIAVHRLHQLQHRLQHQYEYRLQYPPYFDVHSDDEDIATDISRDQFENGVDIQGIPWESTPWTRKIYRAKRDSEYRNYYNKEADVILAQPTIQSHATPSHEIDPARKSGPTYQFECNHRELRSSITHFQLRNLVWATSCHDVYFVEDNAVYCWNSMCKKGKMQVINVSGSHPFGYAPDLGSVMLCTLCVKHGLVAAGGFWGELLVHEMRSENPYAANFLVSDDNNNAITNAIEIFHTTSGALAIACSNNDHAIRLFDPKAGFRKTSQFDLPWAVNFTAPHPDGRLLCAAGDDPVSRIIDPSSGATVASLHGHYDYSFAAAWHPSGYLLATGNQDKTTRVYDLRMPSKTLYLLPANIGSVRSLRWSPNGERLAVAEPADYVTIYDISRAESGCGDDGDHVKKGSLPKQTIDVFGELSGISFSPDGHRLFIGTADVNYSSLLQYNYRVHS